MTNRSLLKDETLTSLLDKDGFVQVPFLSHGQVKELEEAFYDLFGEMENRDVYNSLEGAGAEQRRLIHNKILSVCQPVLDKYLHNYKVVIAMYFAKRRGENGLVGIHNDPSMVMEGFGHLGVWIPLVDSNENNGAMHFLRGSHKFFRPYWAKTITTPYASVNDMLPDHMECIPTKAGNAIIFDNNALHCTYNNRSDKLRIALIIKVIDKDAQLITLFRNPQQADSKIEILAHDDEFYLSPLWQDNMERPKVGKSIGYLDYTPPTVNARQMLGLINGRTGAKKPGLLKRLAEMFS